MKAYHFTNDKLRDGSPIPAIGEWLEYTGEVKICQSGLHYSKHPFDALTYAPGNLLHLVEVEDVVDRHKDKGVCRRRKIIATIDAEELLRSFARKCALDVIHLWDAPTIVREYLETGNEELRTAARTAARDAARDAARTAARTATWAAAWDAARDAAWAAAGDAAWDAARSAARSAAWDAARSADWDAARTATWAAAWDAAWAATGDAQRKAFKNFVDAAFKEASCA